MDTMSLLLGLLMGAAVAAFLVYFILRSSTVQRSLYEDLKSQLLTLKAEVDFLHRSEKQLMDSAGRLERQCQGLQHEKENWIAENAQLQAVNEGLSVSLENQKEELSRLQEQAKEQFENLANRILEEKSAKFTLANQSGLKSILEPFQEKINDLKNRVNEAYEKENRERFSLGEKVRELAILNQQISEDAKRLTKALKGESKTQGSWGEMILASILEKSGLERGREYFLEYQLKDENNRALFSEFSGKKMRPDAIVLYPDERTVIIDAKVSLTAFTDLVDETDSDIYQIKLKRHLDSVKRHIDELSSKAYDDYKDSLDFVMMFIPNEPAYIAVMQADPQLWNYAYEKRVIILNPSNLITSLKLIADLWKRDKQTRNVMDIAERGGKLYNKFVEFVVVLEKVGSNLNTAQSAYEEAYKKLYTGNDNLVKQTQKLKDLGVKNKKQLPPSLVDRANLESDVNVDGIR